MGQSEMGFTRFEDKSYAAAVSPFDRHDCGGLRQYPGEHRRWNDPTGGDGCPRDNRFIVGRPATGYARQSAEGQDSQGRGRRHD